MALYVPAAKRRRRTLLLVGAAVVVGLVVGALAGRVSAPTVDDRIASVRDDARQTAAGLRVIALHDESNAVSSQAPGDGGVDLVLRDTREQLNGELDRAPWITVQQREALLEQLDELQARGDRTGASFGEAADAMAGAIETTFGVSR
jgi:hypothetical protein